MAFVIARPDAFPACRMFAISAGLLMTRNSCMSGFSDLTVLSLSSFWKANADVSWERKKREKVEEDFAMSV